MWEENTFLGPCYVTRRIVRSFAFFFPRANFTRLGLVNPMRGEPRYTAFPGGGLPRSTDGARVSAVKPSLQTH